MRASTYLAVAERRAANAQDVAADLFNIAQGKPVYSPSEPRSLLGYVERDATKVSALVEAALNRTQDPYLRDRALDQDARATRALKSACYDVDAAEEHYFADVEVYITP